MSESPDSGQQPCPRSPGTRSRIGLALALAVGYGLAAPLSVVAAAAGRPAELSLRAQRQIEVLLAEKRARTPVERKMGSRLLHLVRRQRGESFAPGAGQLAPRVAAEALEKDGRVLLDIEAAPGDGVKAVLARLEAVGAEIVYASLVRGTLRARLPVEEVEALAALPALRDIRLAHRAVTSGINTSEGDVAHRAEEVRQVFGVTGDRVKVGVVSNGVGSVPLLQATGDLPQAVTVLPGQEGPGDEGSAMLEIVHDLAPGAELFFATGALGPSGYADNILALREAGCDVIVDDLFYLVESPFQDTEVAQAVRAVVDDGALYFSAAGNGGNLNDGTASTWEGDFVAGGTVAALGEASVHDFGSGTLANRLLGNTPVGVTLQWADAAGASANDYDLFVLDEDLQTVFDFSTDIQDGDDDPYEQIGPSFTNEQLVVVSNAGAAGRFLHLASLGAPLAVATDGCVRGHNAVAGAFAVAAVNVASAQGGPFLGGAENPVESFSCDGPRRIFFHPDGTPVTPGDFSATGGEVRSKPDLAAADGVATATSGFERFFGTSAAAPHAAAMAALAKSVFPELTAAQLRAAIESAALDIEAPGADRDSGAGILMVYETLQELGAQPAALLRVGALTATELSGNGDGFIQPGETLSLDIRLSNVGGAPAAGMRGTLTVSVPGVTLLSGASDYPLLDPGEVALNSQPFTLSLDSEAACGVIIQATLTVDYDGGNRPQQTFDLQLVTGRPAAPRDFSYGGPAVPIPDAEETGKPGLAAEVPIVVQGLSGSILDLEFRIGGSLCSTAAGATTVGVDHTFATDLTFTLESPQGTVARLIDLVDLSGNNFCQTLLDDQTDGPSILSVTTQDAPFTGTFLPQTELAVFNGEEPNGTWILRVTDSFTGDVGNVRDVSLIISAAECDLKTCDAGGDALFLRDGRFKVETCFRNQHGGGVEGIARPIPHADRSGFFWFFDPDNIELIVKLLDGTRVNGNFWFFSGALSDVEYLIKVTDTETGQVQTYHNPPGEICGVGDIRAFASPPALAVAGSPGSVLFAPAPRDAEGGADGSCSPGPLDLCLLDGRFQVQVHWRNQHNGTEGEGHSVPSTDESGLFWFFDASNIELVVKILDGTSINGKFWVFYGALSDVEYTITVTDTVTGAIKTYTNEAGNICGDADTNAL